MAVEIKYVVIREGEEKMSFASKKEADVYDKMLDLAEVLNDWLVACPLELDEAQRDNMSMWLAERKDALHHILKSGKLPEAEEHAEAAAEMPESAPTEDEAQPGAAEEGAAKKPRKAKAA
ncbi:TPA: YebG family protein [Klebsiella aerogenes]